MNENEPSTDSEELVCNCDDLNFNFDKESCGEEECSSGKKQYCKKTAETLKNKLHKKGKWPLRVYQCPECNWWHLTHHKKSKYVEA